MVGLSGINSKNYRAILAAKASPVNPNDNQVDAYEEFSDPRPYNIISEVKQQQKHLSETETQEVIAKYQSGISANKLAQEYHCHKTTIRSTLRKNGIAISKQPAGRKVDIQQMIIMYKEMHTIAKRWTATW